MVQPARMEMQSRGAGDDWMKRRTRFDGEGVECNNAEVSVRRPRRGRSQRSCERLGDGGRNCFHFPCIRSIQIGIQQTEASGASGLIANKDYQITKSNSRASS